MKRVDDFRLRFGKQALVSIIMGGMGVELPPPNWCWKRRAWAAGDAARWVQAIQDGHMGVYRRGVSLRFEESLVLQVRLQRRDKQQVLYFPLKLAAS